MGGPRAGGQGIKPPKTTLAEHQKKIKAQFVYVKWHRTALCVTAGGRVAGGPGAGGDGIKPTKTTLAEHSKKFLGREF